MNIYEVVIMFGWKKVAERKLSFIEFRDPESVVVDVATWDEFAIGCVLK